VIVGGSHSGGDRILLRGNHIDLSPAIQLAGHCRIVEGESADLHVAGLTFALESP